MHSKRITRFALSRPISALAAVSVAIGMAGCGTADRTGQNLKPSAPAAAVEITAPGGDQVNPTTPIAVHSQRGKLTSVTVTTSEGKQVSGAMSADGTGWRTSEPLGYDSNYEVTASAKGSDGKPVEQHQTIHTLAPKDQAYPSMIPVPKTTKDVGVGQPVVVRFDKKVKNKAAVEKAMQVSTEPQQQGSWSWISDKEVHYRPQNYWQPGSKVSVKLNLYGVDFGDGVYGETDRQLDFTVHDSWVAKADGNTSQMQVFHNNQFVRSLPISMGKDVTPTHTGAHVISDKQQKYTMDSCTFGVCQGQPGYYHGDEFFALRISNDGEFVHENPASVAQQGSSNVSHGCINLDQANADWFFQNFGLGDVVEVANSGGPQLPVWDTYGDWAVSWDKWKSGSALK